MCVFFNFKMCFHCCVTFVFFKAAQQPRRTYSSVLRAFQGCPLGGPSKTRTATFELIVGFRFRCFLTKVKFFIWFQCFLFRQADKNNNMIPMHFFEKAWYIIKFFFVACKHLPITEHPNHVCISKYMLIRYQLAPCCIVWAFDIYTWLQRQCVLVPFKSFAFCGCDFKVLSPLGAHDATPKKSWHGPSLVKQTGSHWAKGKGFSRCWQLNIFFWNFHPAKLGKIIGKIRFPFWRAYSFQGGLVQPPTRKGFLFQTPFFSGDTVRFGIFRGSSRNPRTDVSG